MGFFKDLFNSFGEYKKLEKLGISKEQAIKLDEMDGKKDKQLNGRSLFEVASEYKDAYENNPLAALTSESLFDYISKNYGVINTMKMLQEVTVLGIETSDDIAGDLIENEDDMEKSINKINADNVTEVLQKYKEKSDKNHRFLGIKYDNETLMESILESDIPDQKKIEYFKHIRDALIEKVESLTGDASYLRLVFDVAIKVTMGDESFKDSRLLDEAVDKFMKVIEQLEKMDEANRRLLSDIMSGKVEYNDLSDEEITKINSFLSLLDIAGDDALGNGYFDNNAVQMTGNCWAHGDINSMLQSVRGRQYINNLITKSNEGITSVYLPGAKDEGLPPPKGDGIFTYTEADIARRSLEESLGDGDYTAFMMAVTDYRKLARKDSSATSDGEGTEFPYLIFGKDYKKWGFNVSSSDEDINKVQRKRRKNLYTSRKLSKQLKAFDPKIYDAKTRFENFKKLFEQQDGYFSVAITEVMDKKISAKYLSNGQDVLLRGNHVYSIVAYRDNYVILQESNNPQEKLVVDYKSFMDKFLIRYYEFPDDMV